MRKQRQHLIFTVKPFQVNRTLGWPARFSLLSSIVRAQFYLYFCSCNTKALELVLFCITFEEWILMPKKRFIKRNKITHMRLTASEKREAEKATQLLSLKNVSEYFRYLHSKHIQSLKERVTPIPELNYEKYPTLFHKTKFGKIYHGDSLALLHEVLPPHSIDLIITSPPFGLTNPKAYGNRTDEEYLRWFRQFAFGFKRVLKSTGSLVIDIGGAWTKGEPTKSLYHFELLLMLCKDFQFNLAQDHYWWNPSKLPTPAEWVNVRRCRVKDAINCIWWLSPSTRPKATNYNVLSPYSDSMKKLLEDGYSRNLRPSGHDISSKFQRDNGGAVPPNLIALANTESNSSYQQYCRKNNLPVHPARFPFGIPEYFIKFLTEPGDLVFDPFGGSCITGEVAEKLRRKWICGEMVKDYLKGALGRFISSNNGNLKKRKVEPYKIFPPCTPVDEVADKVFS